MRSYPKKITWEKISCVTVIILFNLLNLMEGCNNQLTSLSVQIYFEWKISIKLHSDDKQRQKPRKPFLDLKKLTIEKFNKKHYPKKIT